MSDAYIWFVILALGIGTYLIRFSFLGLIGDRKLPRYFEQMLGYTSVAVLPGLAAPIVFARVDGEFEVMRLVAVSLLLIVGLVTRNMMQGLMTGLITYFAGSWLIGLF